jgi:PhnB protein
MIMGSDAPPEMYKPPQGFSVSLSIASTADAERIFKELSVGGSVQMPIQKTFWAERFGAVTDRFGTPWMLSAGEQA